MQAMPRYIVIFIDFPRTNEVIYFFSVQKRVHEASTATVARRTVPALGPISSVRLWPVNAAAKRAGRAITARNDFAATACMESTAKRPASVLPIMRSGEKTRKAPSTFDFKPVWRKLFRALDCCIFVCRSCHPWSGKCKCKAGWTGATCSRPCPYFKYGEDCQQDCSCSKSGTTLQCLPNNGTCICSSGTCE